MRPIAEALRMNPPLHVLSLADNRITEVWVCVVRPGSGFPCWDCLLHIVVVPFFPREGVSYAWPFLQ